MVNDVEKLLCNSTILDACSVYSLYATGQMANILTWVPGQVYIASYVKNVEIKHLYNPLTDRCDIPIDLTDILSSRLLIVTRPAGDAENQDAITFATGMSSKKPGKNTGEAISGAIARARKWSMVTDDVPATNYLAHYIGSSLLTTLHVIQWWSIASALGRNSITEILKRVLIHARYRPPIQHPLYEWWYESSASNATED